MLPSAIAGMRYDRGNLSSCYLTAIAKKLLNGGVKSIL